MTDDKNWYVRMHKKPAVSEQRQDKQFSLNLSIFFRIWFTVALVMIIAGGVVFRQLFEYIEPTTKQVIEDTLVDTSKFLAVVFATPLEQGQLTNPNYQAQLDTAFNQSSPVAYTAVDDNNVQTNVLHQPFLQKINSSFRVYITDKSGKVLYDSLPSSHTDKVDNLPNNENAEGKDYSQWNDVYLSLQGKYGARSSHNTQTKEQRQTTEPPKSIMYVAQPIRNAQGEILGVVSVGKPVETILPYIDVARQQMLTTSLAVALLAVLFAGVIAWWLRQSIALVKQYTSQLASDVIKPSFYFGRELNELTDSIETMKHRLDNKGYVSDYVHTLTHELKSPLTAIKASGELLADSSLDDEDRQILSETINEQSQKLQLLIDRLLLLSKVEQPSFQLNTKPTAIISLLHMLLDNQQVRIKQRELTLRVYHNNQLCNMNDLVQLTQQLLVMADEFWLSQALNNILENAINFAKANIIIRLDDKVLTDKKSTLHVHIVNDANPIPSYALDKVFDRYFSLSHQSHTQKKGTGLGLTLAKQVIEHHGGQISIANTDVSEYVKDVKLQSAVVVSIII